MTYDSSLGFGGAAPTTLGGFAAMEWSPSYVVASPSVLAQTHTKRQAAAPKPRGMRPVPLLQQQQQQVLRHGDRAAGHSAIGQGQPVGVVGGGFGQDPTAGRAGSGGFSMVELGVQGVPAQPGLVTGGMGTLHQQVEQQQQQRYTPPPDHEVL
jgi:hypothetical protein